MAAHPVAASRPGAANILFCPKNTPFFRTAAPFEEKRVTATSTGGAAEARKRLQAALDQLNPGAGKVEPPRDPAAKAANAQRFYRIASP